MNAMKSLLWLAAISLPTISACNYTVGDCYPRGEGAGYSTEGVGSGGGVIIPTGVGGFGEAPPKQPQSGTSQPLVCNSDETENPCRGSGDTAGDGTTYVLCSEPCPQNDLQCLSGVISMFRASNFSFVTIIADDGKDLAGGWQESNTALAFAHNLFEIVTCSVRIGMPLRTKAWGTISASTAAIYSADVANAAAAKVWPTDLPSGIFCSTLKKEMDAQFAAKYQNLGARIMNP